MVAKYVDLRDLLTVIECVSAFSFYNVLKNALS